MVKALAAQLRKERADIEVNGFYTDEVLGKDGKRIGFDVVTLDEKRGILSRKGGLPASYPKTGKYSVDVEGFERVAIESLKYKGEENEFSGRAPLSSSSTHTPPRLKAHAQS